MANLNASISCKQNDNSHETVLVIIFRQMRNLFCLFLSNNATIKATIFNAIRLYQPCICKIISGSIFFESMHVFIKLSEIFHL